MTEKIEWYREVLELEPNSKVFFPLARLLAEDNERAQAIEVLERGLDRHPEFLEARLFLIELLHSSGQKEKCTGQVEKLSRMFSSYAGFWQAWAACLSNERGEGDTASILRFLAAQFISGPVSLHEVITRGVQAILADSQDASAPKETAVQASNTATDAPAEPSDTVPSDQHDDSSVEPQPELPEEAALAALSGELAIESDAPETGLPSGECQAEPCDSMLPELENMPEEPAVEPEASGESPAAVPPTDAEIVSAADSLPEAEMAAEPSPVTEPDETNVAAEMLQAMTDFADQELTSAGTDTGDVDIDAAISVSVPDDAAEQANEIHSHVASDTTPSSAVSGDNEADAEPAPHVAASQTASIFANDEPAEESFTLRTRSMAEVLAEQGDIQGALDIYHELAASAANSDEEDDIARRMATLQAQLDLMKPLSGMLDPDSVPTDSGKEKLIGMLETLARRVEARVHN